MRIGELRSGSEFWRSGGALLLCAVSGPVWKVILVPLPGASVTVGRALLLVTAVLLFIDARRARERAAVPRQTWWLGIALGALWLWMVVNTLALGCRCAGDVAGYSEVAALAILAALTATFEPRLRPAIVIAVVLGCGLSAGLALLGVDGLTSGARNTASLQTRLTGTYGNPNLLAFAIGPGLPAAIAVIWFGRPRLRLLAGVCASLIAVALVLSFSRGGLLAAAAGAALVLLLIQPRRTRARRLTGMALLLAAAAGAAAYPVFADLRRSANTTPPNAALRSADVSGWDARQLGVIPRGPAEIANPRPGILEVRASARGEGVSRWAPSVARGSRHELRFEARVADGRQQRLGFALGTSDHAVVRTARIGSTWRDLRIRWRAGADAGPARFSAWAATAPGRFQVRDVTGGAAGPISVRLLGSEYARQNALRRAWKQSHDLQTREVAARLAFRGFAAEPLFGIGWGHFPDYAAARSAFGRLATHDEYLRFMVELGLLGVLLLGGLVGVVFNAARRGRDAPGLAVLGILATAAVGLLFLNGLIASSAALPLALAMGAACAGAVRTP